MSIRDSQPTETMMEEGAQVRKPSNLVLQVEDTTFQLQTHQLRGGNQGEALKTITTMAIITGRVKRAMAWSFQLRQALVMTMKKTLTLFWAGVANLKKMSEHKIMTLITTMRMKKAE